MDQVALYGTGAAGNQPLGLINVAGVNQAVPIDPANLHPSFCAVEELVETANVSMDSYGVIVSPGTRKILRSTPGFPGGSITTWAEIRGGQSSPEVTDAKAFAGCWNNLTFCLWGRGVELLVDHLTLALTGQVKIYATLLADVGGAVPKRIRGHRGGDLTAKVPFERHRHKAPPGDSPPRGPLTLNSR